MRKFFLLTLVLSFGISVVIFSSAFGAAEPAKASGTFTLEGVAYKITNVMAKTEPNAFDEKKNDVVVLLTDQPVAPKDFDFAEMNMQGHNGKIHGIMVNIDDQKKPVSLLIMGVAQKSGTSPCEFEAVKFDPDFVQGRAYLKAPEETFGKKYMFDVQFQAPITNPAAAAAAEEASGTPLPPGGGDPGKAFMEYDKVLNAGDLEKLKTMMAPDQAKELSKPEAKQMLGMIKMMRASNIKITKGFINGDKATLMVEGKDNMAGGQTTGTVKMMKVNNRWLVMEESWKGKMN
jgi:hypothetical protein